VSQRPRVYHTDPAKDLNPTEDQWNAIVMANFEKHKQEKLSVKKNALEKNKENPRRTNSSNANPQRNGRFLRQRKKRPIPKTRYQSK